MYPITWATAYLGGIEISMCTVIDDQVPFQNLALLLLGQPAKYLPEVLTQLLVELLAPTFRNEHDMVFAFPFRMP